MIDANRARKQAEYYLHNNTSKLSNKLVQKIYKKINKASNNGETCLSFNLLNRFCLMFKSNNLIEKAVKLAKEELERNGYKVKHIEFYYLRYITNKLEITW